MRFKQGTGVYTADDRHVGDVARVVIDPDTKEVTHLIIEKGFLFTHDKVVPVAWVDRATDERVTLKPVGQEFDELPDFEETYYIPAGTEPSGAVPPVGDANYARPYYWNPPVGTAWWGYPGYADYPRDYYVAVSERNIPDDTVPLKEGAKVISADEDTVGRVKEFLVDDTTERVTHLVVSEGLLFKKEIVIPTNWISTVGEDEIWLAVDTDTLDTLPDYTG